MILGVGAELASQYCGIGAENIVFSQLSVELDGNLKNSRFRQLQAKTPNAGIPKSEIPKYQSPKSQKPNP